MPDLELRLNVTDARPAYEVLVNDGGADGGSTARMYVGGDPIGVPPETLDAAVQAFADILDAVPSYSISSIKRLTVTGTSL